MDTILCFVNYNAIFLRNIFFPGGNFQEHKMVIELSLIFKEFPGKITDYFVVAAFIVFAVKMEPSVPLRMCQIS